MEKSLEEQIKEQEQIVKKFNNVTKDIRDWLFAENQLLKLKLQLAESKGKEYIKISKGCPVAGNCDKVCDDCFNNNPKKNTLFDYYEKYAGIKLKDEIRNAKDGSCEMSKVMILSHLSFEKSCGLLKYICQEISKKFGASETNSSIVLNRNIGEYQVWTTTNSPFTAHHDALHEVIRICGTEFLDKIFKA